MRSLAPRPIASLGRRLRKAYRARKRNGTPALGEAQFRDLLVDRLQIDRCDIVLVHSSLDGLRLDFPWFRLLGLLRDVVGPRGTLLFPTYPRGLSSDFLREGAAFDVRATQSYTGALSELARRTAGAVRSLHPTKSLCALGPAAEELCGTHHLSRYPYDATSPYWKLAQSGGKTIGLGVSTARMSLVHAVDDFFKETFPVQVYLPGVFRAACIDAAGRTVVVETFAHDVTKMRHDVPRYCRRNLPPEMCQDLKIGSTEFFRADAKPLLEAMVARASRGITIYPRSVQTRKDASRCASD
ncbi:MAG: AAC(3) family N-acetyltransferase [Pirellulales bacterium]